MNLATQRIEMEEYEKIECSAVLPKDVYLEIKKIAAKEGRTLGGQLRFIYSQYVSEEQTRVKELVDAEMTLRKAKDHSLMS